MVSILCSPLSAKETGTITTSDGIVYENVTFKIDQMYKVVSFKLEGRKRNISFTRIKSIVDADGNDITTEMLGNVYHSQRETWEREDSKIIRQARKGFYDFNIQVGPLASASSGSYYEGFKSGIGFGGHLRVPLTYRLAFKLHVSKSGLDADNRSLYLYSLDPNFSIVSQKFSVNAMRYTIDFEYYRQPQSKRGGRTMYYIHTGLGAVNHKLKLDLRVRDNTNGQLLDFTEQDSETKFIQTFGGGLVLMISDNIGIDLGVNIDFVYAGLANDNNAFTNDLVYAYIFDIRLGLSYFLK